MTEEQIKKLEVLKYRLSLKPAMFKNSLSENRRYMTNFTYEQTLGNVEEMRKIVDELLENGKK